MRLARFAVPAVTALALAACATTAAPPPDDATAAYFAEDFTCAAPDAQSVALSALRRAPEDYEGRCVSVSGFAKGNVLFHDAQDAGARTAARRIGLDWKDDALARRLQLGPSFVTIIGRLRLCSRRRAMIARKAPATPETGCRDAVAALTVSSAAIIPTAMD